MLTRNVQVAHNFSPDPLPFRKKLNVTVRTVLTVSFFVGKKIKAIF